MNKDQSIFSIFLLKIFRFLLEILFVYKIYFLYNFNNLEFIINGKLKMKDQCVSSRLKFKIIYVLLLIIYFHFHTLTCPTHNVFGGWLARTTNSGPTHWALLKHLMGPPTVLYKRDGALWTAFPRRALGPFLTMILKIFLYDFSRCNRKKNKLS